MIEKKCVHQLTQIQTRIPIQPPYSRILLGSSRTLRSLSTSILPTSNRRVPFRFHLQRKSCRRLSLIPFHEINLVFIRTNFLMILQEQCFFPWMPILIHSSCPTRRCTYFYPKACLTCSNINFQFPALSLISVV